MLSIIKWEASLICSFSNTNSLDGLKSCKKLYVNVLIWLLILVQDFFSSSEIFDGIPSGIKLSDENWTGVSICFLEDFILLIC